jgi:hypothetical protein
MSMLNRWRGIAYSASIVLVLFFASACLPTASNNATPQPSSQAAPTPPTTSHSIYIAGLNRKMVSDMNDWLRRGPEVLRYQNVPGWKAQDLVSGDESKMTADQNDIELTMGELDNYGQTNKAVRKFWNCNPDAWPNSIKATIACLKR